MPSVDQPQPVGAGVEQIPVMRDQNDRALVIIDRLDQGGAAVDVEMVGRLVENQQMRPVEGREPHQQARLFAAGELRDLGVGFHVGKADLGAFGADLRLGRLAHELGDALIGRRLFVEIVDLMLGEKPDLEFGRAPHAARLAPAAARRRAWRRSICHCRWSRAGRCGHRPKY